MNNKIYDDQMMIAYLLGSLPESEAARFDELSFTDDEFAEKLKIAENDLVDAYIQGELQNSTLEKFESYYLASPVRREKVKFAQSFQIFAEKNGAAQTAGIFEETSENNKKKRAFTGFFSALNIFAAPRPVLQWSLAAVVLLFAALGGLMIIQNSRRANQISQTDLPRIELREGEKQSPDEITEQPRVADLENERQAANVREEIARLEKEKNQKPPGEPAREQKQPAEQNRKRIEQQKLIKEQEIAAAPKSLPKPRPLNIASFVLTPPLRGSDQLPALSIPPKTDLMVMRLEIEPNDYKSYRVALRDQAANRIVWQSRTIKAKNEDENKRLDVRFPAALLKSQIYSLEISGVGAGGTGEIIGDYFFRIVR